MPRRGRLLTGGLLAGCSFAGAVLFRRRFAKRPERVDLYYEDGSMSSVVEGTPDGERLLPLARGVLAAARR
jgi:hypothetical protein